jgi:hypothetical protein
MLEMLDPQRFTRGVEVRPQDLKPVMVRRLKRDLRRLGEAFPLRTVEPIVLDGLPTTTPELELARRLTLYGATRMKRIGASPKHKAGLAKLAYVQLQQRLLSSMAAFDKTLRVHRAGLERLIEKEETLDLAAPDEIIDVETTDIASDLGLEGEAAEEAISADEDAAAEGGDRRRRSRSAIGRTASRVSDGQRHALVCRAARFAPRRAGEVACRLDQAQSAAQRPVEPSPTDHLHPVGRHAKMA